MDFDLMITSFPKLLGATIVTLKSILSGTWESKIDSKHLIVTFDRLNEDAKACILILD